ncbi:MAG: hypothetical protein NTZ40_05180 [Cyanobacteria bacterium]|nr:hypothetical protein [Cyanobacteriota bacterium]
MSGTYPNPIARRRRPQPVVSVASGFVLILVLPAAMLLIMTALSLVTRSNSAAVASSQESRAQAARMAAEYGFNQMMALVNKQYDTSNTPLSNSLLDRPIDGEPGVATYTITYNSLSPVSPIPPCTSIGNADLSVTVEAKLLVDSTTYRRQITRTLSVCDPLGTSINRLRVRAIK